MSPILRFLKSEDGPTAVEYAVMLALITITCIGGVNMMVQSTKESFEASSDAINNL